MTQTTKKTKRAAPFSVRLNDDERLALQNAAQGVSLGAYVKAKLFELPLETIPARNRAPIKDHISLSKVLAWFGSSRLPQNLNQLAKAANTGSLPILPETETALKFACEEVRDICRLIREALGFKP
jgi:hypothetical protein